MLSSLYFQVLTHQYQVTPTHGLFFRTGVHNGLIVDPVFPDRVSLTKLPGFRTELELHNTAEIVQRLFVESHQMYVRI